MSMLATVFAWGWEPEVRGITAVLLMFVVLCGATYLLLATNLGWRNGFLVAFAGFFGWMFLMGAVWWVYGIGLQGALPSWQPVEVIVDGRLDQANTDVARSAAGVVGQLKANAAEREAEAARLEAEGRSDEAAEARSSVGRLVLDGWRKLPEDDPGRGQAQAAADDILVNQAGTFAETTEYLAQGVYRFGGQTYPEWFFNFRHKPHYNLVEVQPVVPQRTEPGQAPPRPVADTSRPATYVLMIRDLGYRRRPAALITIGSGIIFGLSCVALSRRDKLAAKNRGTDLVKAG